MPSIILSHFLNLLFPYRPVRLISRRSLRLPKFAKWYNSNTIFSRSWSDYKDLESHVYPSFSKVFKYEVTQCQMTFHVRQVSDSSDSSERLLWPILVLEVFLLAILLSNLLCRVSSYLFLPVRLTCLSTAIRTALIRLKSFFTFFDEKTSFVFFSNVDLYLPDSS